MGIKRFLTEMCLISQIIHMVMLNVVIHLLHVQRVKQI